MKALLCNPQELQRNMNLQLTWGVFRDMMVDSLVYEEPLETRQLIWPSTKPPQQPVFEQRQILRIIKEVCWS